MPNDSQDSPFNNSLSEKLQKALPANVRKRKRRGTKEQMIQRVLIAVEMLEQGASNNAINRRCNEEVGLPLHDNTIWHLRNGTYRGWGSDQIYSRKRETADVPPAEPLTKKTDMKTTGLVVRSIDNEAIRKVLRALVVVMNKEGLAKVCVDENRRVTVSKVEISEWTLD